MSDAGALFEQSYETRSTDSKRPRFNPEEDDTLLFVFKLPSQQVYIGSRQFSAATLEVRLHGLILTDTRRPNECLQNAFNIFIPFGSLKELLIVKGWKGIAFKPYDHLVKPIRHALMVKQSEFDADGFFNSVLVLLPPMRTHGNNNKEITQKSGCTAMALAFTADTKMTVPEMGVDVMNKMLDEIRRDNPDLPPNMLIDESGNYCAVKQEVKTEVEEDQPAAAACQPSCKKVKVESEPE